MIYNFEKDTELIKMEQMLMNAATDIINSKPIGRVSTVLSLFNGKAKKQMNASNMYFELIEAIFNHLIFVIRIPNIETYVDYYNNYILKIAKIAFPLATKLSVEKEINKINKKIAKGEIRNFKLDTEGNFILIN